MKKLNVYKEGENTEQQIAQWSKLKNSEIQERFNR